MKRRRRDAVDAFGDRRLPDIQSGVILPSEVSARLEAFSEERLRYHAAVAEARTGIPASALLAREKGMGMGFHQIELTATRLKRRRSKWLSYIGPVGAALALAVIAIAILAGALFMGGGGR